MNVIHLEWKDTRDCKQFKMVLQVTRGFSGMEHIFSTSVVCKYCSKFVWLKLKRKLYMRSKWRNQHCKIPMAKTCSSCFQEANINSASANSVVMMGNLRKGGFLVSDYLFLNNKIFCDSVAFCYFLMGVISWDFTTTS